MYISYYNETLIFQMGAMLLLYILLFVTYLLLYPNVIREMMVTIQVRYTQRTSSPKFSAKSRDQLWLS